MAYTYGSVTNCKVRNGQTRTEYECRIGYQVNSQDINNNSSNVTLRLECRSISSSYVTKGSSGLTSVIDGTTVKSNAAVDMSHTNVWQNFGERTITIAHNADGTCSVSKSGSFTCTAGSSSYSLSSGSASVTVAPATIPRATTPTLSSSSIDLNTTVTISTPRASNSFTHNLTYSFGSASGTIASSVATSTTWTPPLSLANQIPSATKANCVITCRTYDGSTLIGTKTVNLELKVPSSVVPTINSVTLSEGNSTMTSLNWGVYVQSKSQLRVVTSASGAYSSTIVGYKITGIDGNTYNSSNFLSNTLTQSGNKTITVVVTDSRGRTATTTQTYTCVAYSNPTITSSSAKRCNSDGTDNDEGTSIKYIFNATISPVSNHNTHVFKIGYKESSDSSYTYVTIANDSYTLTKNNVVLTGVTFSADNVYDIRFYTEDAFTSSSKSTVIQTAFALINFNESGKAFAIGKVSQASSNEKLIELAMPTISGETFNRGAWNAPTKGLVTQITDNSGNQHSVLVGLASDGSSRIYGVDLADSDSAPQMRIYLGSSFFGLTSNSAEMKGWLRATKNGNTVTIGSQSEYYCHFVNSADIPFHFNKEIYVNGTQLAKVPVVAYENASGTSGTITMSASANNYKNMRVSYFFNGNEYCSNTFSGTSNMNGYFWLSSTIEGADANYSYSQSCLLEVSGTTITLSRNRQTGFSKNDNEIYTPSGDVELYITKVEMWN